MRVPLLLSALLVALLVPERARADSIETFSLDSRTVAGTTKTLSGSTATVKLSDVVIDGVTFDATVTVAGSSTLTRTSSGLGVSGSNSALLNHGEALTFSLAITNVRGGSATFEGFTGLDFTFFTTKGETAVFSTDASLATTCDNWLTHTALADPDISNTAPSTFTLFGKDGTAPGGGAVTTSFRVDSISGSFATAAPVPEPGTLALLGAAGLAAAVRSRCRRRKT